MTQEELVVIHGDIIYLGGEFDEKTKRAYYGDHWEERIDSALEEYEETTAIAYLDTGADASTDDEFIKRPRELRDQTHLPYSFHKYDNILEDDKNGNLKEEQLEQITSEKEQLTVAGVWLNDCVSRFIDNILDYDQNITVKIDPEYAAVRPETPGPTGLGNREEILGRSIQEDEKKRAESPPAATQNTKKLEKFRSNYKRKERVEILEEKVPKKEIT